jgi:hypothetical protein
MKRFHGELAIFMGDRLSRMTRHRIGKVERQPVFPSQGLKAMAPRMIRKIRSRTVGHSGSYSDPGSFRLQVSAFTTGRTGSYASDSKPFITLTIELADSRSALRIRGALFPKKNGVSTSGTPHLSDHRR